MTDLYITTSIPYVNGAPHLGHALELVHVDALARHRASGGAAVRVQSGTDDHAIKNVSAASAATADVADFVAANGDRFAALADRLGVRTDEFVRTSRDPRHRAAVTALWEACRAAGDLYRTEYRGRYCAGCEAFLETAELSDGRCPEHGTEPAQVSETNWFFRLSRYRGQLVELIRSGALEVTPAARRNEVLGFLAGDVRDLSVSRPARRAGGWGIPVPGDPEQVVYVWFDALVNYLTGLGYGAPDTEALDRWWGVPGPERVHVVGKGIVRFHAVFWAAFLLSAGLPVPTRVLVHDYLTVFGTKIAKSGAQAADPVTLIDQYGTDTLRWWLLADPAPVGTTDFTVERLLAAYDRDLANIVGNLASRTLTLARRKAPWREPTADAPAGEAPVLDRVDGADQLLTAATELPARVAAALDAYNFRSACRSIIELAENTNRLLESHAPWRLAKAADIDAGDDGAAPQFEAVVAVSLTVCRTLACELAPFVPDGADRLAQQLAAADPGCGRPQPAFPRRIT